MTAMGQDLNRHPDESELESYSMGQLRGGEEAGFEEHLLICEYCRRRLAETDAYVASMRGAAAHLLHQSGQQARQQSRQQTGFSLLEPEPEAQRYWWNWLHLAPALVALMLLMVAVFAWWSWHSGVTPPAPFAVTLEATRSAGIRASAPAGRRLLARLDLAGLPSLASFRLEMVDGAGTLVWQASAASHDAIAKSEIPGVPAGVYFIRVYSPGGELLREFGLRVRAR